MNVTTEPRAYKIPTILLDMSLPKITATDSFIKVELMYIGRARENANKNPKIFIIWNALCPSLSIGFIP